MFRVLVIISLLVLPLSSVAQSSTNYISDDVYIFIHGGPGNQYRILGSIEAGQPVTNLGVTQGDYTQVVDHKDREGWIKNEFLSFEPSFREQIPALTSELESTKQELANITNSSSNMSDELRQAKAQVAELESALTQAQQQRDTAEARAESAIDNQRYHMWQQGGMIAGIGVLIGIILVYLPRPRRKQSNRWM
ncbi:TIGR04211 family SH3 domain-containing protein [Shewanella maritima]|uniref:TIGR04211 family SH3 domain-containing protein n=1 Tax=Shewanella maritima TaxID=2520507 RepID=UPI003736081D